MYDKEKAQHAIDFIECLKLTGDFYGKPFEMVDWARKVVGEVYGTITERGVRQFRHIYIEIPKKNSKSQLLSGIAIYHLFKKDEPNGQIFGCAGDRAQASIIFDMAVAMIDQEPELEKRVRIQSAYKRITNKATGTFYQVLSAESFTKHGLNPTVVLFDELHVQPNRDLYDVMTRGSGLARKQPLYWYITTAGLDPDRTTIGWEVHEKAAAIIEARRAGDKSKDVPNWYPVIYGYQGDDIYNEKNWYTANPSLGVTIKVEDMRELAAEAKFSKADELNFRWLHLNQWMTTKLAAWLPLELFDETAAKDWSRKDLLGKICYLGADLSTTTDLSGTCLVFPPQDGFDKWRVIWDAFIPEDNMHSRIREDKVPYDQWAAGGWLIPTPGNVIDYNRIETRILEQKVMYDLVEMGSDPSFATMLLQRLDEQGVKCVIVPQYYKDLTDPMNLIETLMRSGQLEHEPNPVARWCFGNTSIHKNGNAQIKYVKESRGRGVIRTKRIDLTAAWVAAMARAKFHENSASVYNTRGLLTL